MDTKELMMVAVARVDRGAMRLDAWRPDWRRYINPDALLVMHDGRRCVMGQIAVTLGLVDTCGDVEHDCGECYCDESRWYLAGLKSVGLSTEDGRQCGFDRSWNDRVTYDMLETAWLAIITNNR